MSTGGLVAGDVGKAILPMIAGVGFVAQTEGGKATSPMRTCPEVWFGEELDCRGEHPASENRNAHNAPPNPAIRR